MSRPSADVIVIGAGVVGAACAQAAARAGLSVVVVDRGPLAGGTTGAGEGNLLVSDKAPGPELDLARYSLERWARLDETLFQVGGPVTPSGAAVTPGAAHPPQPGPSSGGGFELERKGGLIVASGPRSLAVVTELAAAQRAAGLRVDDVPADRLRDLEPHLAPDLAGGAHYPQDAQLQPMLATARLLADARRHGARVLTGVEVTAFLGRGVTGVRTARGDLHAGAVVNAAGPWAGAVAVLAGVHLPVLPRRGVVLVTQPLPPLIRHKVYAAEYVADVASDQAGLESSAVVEGTPSGTVLVGASRERVGFDPGLPVPVLRRLAAQALRLFPVLGEARLLRAYRGYRPYCPDHLPVIGADPRVPGLVHACGHEGAGVGLAAGTGSLVAQVLTGTVPDLDLTPFRPDRFDRSGVAA